MRVLVAYATYYGATRDIAARIAQVLSKDGLQPALRSVDDTMSADGFDAYVLGSAVHAGHWLKPAAQFFRREVSALDGRPVWLFSSGPLGDAVDKPQPDPKEIAEFRHSTAIRDHIVFGGAFNHASAAGTGLLKRTIGHFMPEGDFRDWPAIETWAHSIAQDLKNVEGSESQERPASGGRGKEPSDGCSICRSTARSEGRLT